MWQMAFFGLIAEANNRNMAFENFIHKETAFTDSQKAYYELEFSKTESAVTVQRQFNANIDCDLQLKEQFMCGFGNLRKVVKCVKKNELAVEEFDVKGYSCIRQICMKLEKFVKRVSNYRFWEKYLAYCEKEFASETLSTSINVTFQILTPCDLFYEATSMIVCLYPLCHMIYKIYAKGSQSHSLPLIETR